MPCKFGGIPNASRPKNWFALHPAQPGPIRPQTPSTDTPCVHLEFPHVLMGWPRKNPKRMGHDHRVNGLSADRLERILNRVVCHCARKSCFKAVPRKKLEDYLANFWQLNRTEMNGLAKTSAC
jgi:hypothetical protein